MTPASKDETSSVRPPISVSDATTADWDVIWPIFTAVTRGADTFVYPTDLSFDDARQIWMMEAPYRTIVAREPGGRLCGTAKIGPNYMGPGAHVASASFMVDPGFRNQGVGRHLCDEALRWASAQGFRSMVFNAVVRCNAAAVKLYQSLGFAIVGTIPEGFSHPSQGMVDLLIMHRNLPTSGLTIDA